MYFGDLQFGFPGVKRLWWGEGGEGGVVMNKGD